MLYYNMAGKKKATRGKKGVSAKQVEKIARKTLYAQIPKKIHYNQGTDFTQLTNANSWLVIQPTFINQGLNNFERAGDQIFVEKCSGFFNLSFNPATTSRVEVRELVGFYKGSADATDKNIAFFSATVLQGDLQNKMASWDRDNYYIKHDKSYDLMPHQVYNAGDGDGQNNPNGIWKSKRIALTHHLYRKYRFTSGTEGGADGNVVEGSFAASNHVMGWKPFIAIQVRCPDQDFTGNGGNNPGPYIDYQFRTMFKDLQ